MTAIRQVGPEASVDDMATEAGVSKPVLYATFGDKSGIADAIAVELVERAAHDLVEELAATGRIELRSALRTGVEAFMDIVSGEPAIYGFIFRSIRSSDKGLLDNPLVRELQARFGLVAKVLVPDADPEMLRVVADGTFGFMVGAVESWRSDGSRHRDAVVTQLVDILAAGLGTIGRPSP